VAKETRTQRRARREAREASSVGAPPTGPPGGTPSASGPPEPAPRGPSQSAAPQEPQRGGPRVIRFIRESSQELKKVEWPTQNQVVTGTTVVLIACIIVGAFLYLNDEVWKRVVEHIVLR
jgi:preprotein translocase SecE subunit